MADGLVETARKACPLPLAVADKASAFGAPMELPWND